MTLTRVEPELFETPQAVTVIDSQEIDEANVSETPALFRYAEGVYKWVPKEQLLLTFENIAYLEYKKPWLWHFRIRQEHYTQLPYLVPLASRIVLRQARSLGPSTSPGLVSAFSICGRDVINQD